MQTRPTHAALIAILVVLALGVVFVLLSHASKPAPEAPAPVATSTPTTQQSSVPADWKTYTDPAQGISFRYPATLGTQYLHETDWPPKVRVSTTTPACIGKPGAPGVTESRTIGDTNYCVTEESEGAAGSTYTTYTYSTQKDGKTVTLSFVIRYPQCANYDEPKMTECKTERDAFKVDDLATRIVQSVSFTP